MTEVLLESAIVDSAIFRRRDPVGRKLRAMHHQLTTDLDFASQRCHSVANDQIIAKWSRTALMRHNASAQLLEGVGDLEHDAATDETALIGKRTCQHFPSAVDLA